MDEKRLAEIDQFFGWADAEFEHPEVNSVGIVESSELHEIVRLARIGLWARNHGIPALNKYKFVASPEQANSVTQFSEAGEALAKLPAESKGVE